MKQSWAQVVSENLSSKLKNIPVSKTNLTNDGTGRLVLPTLEAQKKAEEVLSSDFNLTESQYKPKVILPKLKIVNLNTSLIKTADELKVSIIEKNREISAQLQANTDSELSIMFLDEIRKMAVVKVTPDIREIIMRTKRIFTSMESHFVYDHFYATQCFACQGYGHKQGSEHCTMND